MSASNLQTVHAAITEDVKVLNQSIIDANASAKGTYAKYDKIAALTAARMESLSATLGAMSTTLQTQLGADVVNIVTQTTLTKQNLGFQVNLMGQNVLDRIDSVSQKIDEQASLTEQVNSSLGSDSTSSMEEWIERLSNVSTETVDEQKTTVKVASVASFLTGAVGGYFI